MTLFSRMSSGGYRPGAEIHPLVLIGYGMAGSPRHPPSEWLVLILVEISGYST
jgi:hypothetical protein